MGAYERWKPDTKTVKGETFETIIITRAKDRIEDVQEKNICGREKFFFPIGVSYKKNVTLFTL